MTSNRTNNKILLFPNNKSKNENGRKSNNIIIAQRDFKKLKKKGKIKLEAEKYDTNLKIGDVFFIKHRLDDWLLYIPYDFEIIKAEIIAIKVRKRKQGIKQLVTFKFLEYQNIEDNNPFIKKIKS